MMPKNDLKSLHFAALFKDLGLVLAPNEMIKREIVSNLKTAKSIKTRYDRLWKTLLDIRFLATAMDFISYRYEKYDGSGGRFGIKGTSIPLGSRILAVADSFNDMLSAHPSQEKLALESATQEIVKGSGSDFDPQVVSAFLKVREKLPNLVTIDSL